MDRFSRLSRRERQIMDILHAQGEASANDVLEKLPDPPTPMAMRRMLRIIYDKGLVQRKKRGREIVYKPKQSRQQAGRVALRRALGTFFNGSFADALHAHFTDRGVQLSDDEIQRLHKVIEGARRRK